MNEVLDSNTGYYDGVIFHRYDTAHNLFPVNFELSLPLTELFPTSSYKQETRQGLVQAENLSMEVRIDSVLFELIQKGLLRVIEPFEDEIHPRLRFAHRGIVGMANNGTKNSNDSQFFITLGEWNHC